jgi:hypothetical protein
MPLNEKVSTDVEIALEMTLDSLVKSLNHLRWLQDLTNGPSIVPDEPDEPIEQPLTQGGVPSGKGIRTVQC